MRTKRFFAYLAAVTTAVTTLLASRPAGASGMDPVPDRLVLQPPNLPAGQTCQSIAANPEIAVQTGGVPSQFPCRPDNVAFRNVMSELGFAVAPNAFHPARTTGIGGFMLSLDASFTKVSPNAMSVATDGTKRKYWQDGTEGAIDANTRQNSIRNNSPDSIIQIYSINARKGLPLGFEVVGSLGVIANTTLWVGGADLRWSVLEGFRTGALGKIPDVSIGGGVRTVSGSAKFFLTTVGLDAQISKPFTLADSSVITPYLGYQRLFIFADSTVIDATPNVDAIKQCGYAGTYSGETDPVTGAPLPPEKRSGTPACKNKLSNGSENNGDFNNNMTFERVRVHRHRAIGGLRYRYEVLHLAGQFATDLTDPGDENSGLVGGRQWTISLEAGVFF